MPSACIPLNSTSDINCGSGGVACFSCGIREACINGACVAVDAGLSGRIGDPCRTASDCDKVLNGYSGGPAFCKTAAMVVDGINPPTAGFAYPGGYCTRRCYGSTQCDPGSCVTTLGRYGDGENICLASCKYFPCRPGYFCLDFGTAAAPDPLCVVAGADGGAPERWDAGLPMPSVVIGASCSADSACRPPDNGVCRAALPDGGPAGFPGGFCSASCTMAIDDAWCGGDAGLCTGYVQAWPDGPEVHRVCERKCNPQLGSAECRPEYYCVRLYQYWYPTLGRCVARCTYPGVNCPTYQTCNATTGECQ